MARILTILLILLAAVASAAAVRAGDRVPLSPGDASAAATRSMPAVYLAVPWTWAGGRTEPLPLGVTPAICEGGGRYLNDAGKEDSWFVGGYHGPKLDWDPIKLRAAFEPLPPGLLYVINIEHWPLDIRHHPRAAVEASIDRMLRLVADIRAVNPTIQLGLYGFTPPREYWIPVELSAASTRRPTDFGRLLRATQAHGRWVEAANVNARLLQGPGGLDVSMPSLYRLYGEQHPAYIPEHVRLAVATADGKQAAGLASRPVIGFLCPTHHDRGDAPGTPIGEAAWREDVRLTLESGAQAVIVWDGRRDWSVEKLRPHLEWAFDEARHVRRKAGR